MLGWLDHRTGFKNLIGMLLLEGVPGGARWRYVWGSCLAFVFSIQLITGLMLMTAYSPSSSQAWASVHFIQYRMDFGWLIRGLHHFGSQTMMVLIALHMLQVVIAGAHLPPREVNWWLGIGLLSVTMGLSLTGYLLPWDQKGYWATEVATNIAGTLPEVGAEVKQQAVGGPDTGNHTLTRFYALHVGILPLALMVLLGAHIMIFRRHGVTSRQNQEGLVTKPENEHTPGTESFWPRQAFYDMLACMVVFGLMLSAVLYGFAHPVTTPGQEGAEPGWYEKIARWGTEGKGAELDAAADRDTADYPARPEWYFLFLFQLLKYFKGEHAIYGTVVIPNGVMVLLFLLPLFGVGPLRTVGHYFGMFVVFVLFILVGGLTLAALDDDQPDGILWGVMKNKDDKKGIEAAEVFQHKVREAHMLAQRACQLAMEGSPVEGGHFLIRNDPLTRGRELFQQRCGSCHAFTARESDPFIRTVHTMTLDSDWSDASLAELAKELKKKNIDFSVKLADVKALDEGKRWQLDDKESNWVYFADRHGKKVELSTPNMTDGKTASDLGTFGTKEWTRGLLNDPGNPLYLGRIKLRELDDDEETPKKDAKDNFVLTPASEMIKWRKRIDESRKGWLAGDDDEKKKVAKQDEDFDAIAAWFADQRKPKEKQDKELAKLGKAAFESSRNRCYTCHDLEGTKGAQSRHAPNLTGYGTAEWLRGMIMRPMHATRYGPKNTMPAFRNLEGAGSQLSLKEFRQTNGNPPDNMIAPLSDVERELIIRFILRDFRPVYGGAPIR